MRILLIYPPYSHSSEFDLRTPSMSLVYLASLLEHAGHEVVIFDASLGPITRTGKVYRYGFSEQQVNHFLLSTQFDIAGITCSFAARWRFVENLAQQIKKISTDVPIGIGGLFPTYSWQYCLNNCSAVDFVMLGEAELSFSQIVKLLARGANVNAACRDVDGVAWRDQDRLYSNPKMEYNNHLDNLPFPAWHLVDLHKYFKLQKNIFDLSAPCLPLLSSRGCPNSCRFCNMYLTHGRGWRSRSIENVSAEIKYIIKRFGISNFYFIDDNFSFDLERAKGICQSIIENKLKIKYNFYNGLSIKAVDPELVELMKKSGCTSVCLGIESGSERIRNEIYGKNLKTKEIFEVFHLFHKAKIPTIGYFMVGAPTEDRHDFEKTKVLLAKLPLNLATVSIYTPYPKTELYDECRQKEWLREYSPEDKNRIEMFSPMLRTSDFTPEEVAAWQKELYLSFIRAHWLSLIKEALRPAGVVNFDTISRFIGMVKFRFFNHRLFSQKSCVYKYISFFFAILKGRLLQRNMPIFVTICVTNRCNLECTYCYAKYAKRNYKEFTTEQLLNLIDDLAKRQVKYISLNGGEPLLREDIETIVDRIKERNILCHLSTNGLLIKNNLAVIKKIDSLAISLDGTRESNDSNRGRGVYMDVIENIEYLKENRIKFHTHTVLTENNKHAVEEIVTLAFKYNFKAQFSALRTEHSPNKKLSLGDNDLKIIIKKILDCKKKGGPIFFSSYAYANLLAWPFSYEKEEIFDIDQDGYKPMNCYLKKFSCHIEADGLVYPCIVLVNKFKALNFLDQGFKKAWENLKVNGCEACYNICCNDLNLIFGLHLASLWNVFKIVVERWNLSKK